MMHRPVLRRVSAVVGAAVLIAACSSSPGGSPGSSAVSGGAASDPGDRPSGGGAVGSVAACSLLTTGEIQAAIGAPMAAGVLQTGNPDQADCEWASSDDGSISVGVIVQPYDDFLWQTMSSSQHATAVSGIGEAAYKGFPHAGDLSIKQGGREIDVGIIDFKDDQQKIDAATLTLAKLVLSRI